MIPSDGSSVTESGITLRDIYDQQLRTSAEVSAVRTDVAALTARVEVQFDHGARKMNDHDARLRDVEARIPERLSERLTSLETDRDKGSGSSGAVGRIVTAVIAVAGGGIGSAVVAAIVHGSH